VSVNEVTTAFRLSAGVATFRRGNDFEQLTVLLIRSYLTL